MSADVSLEALVRMKGSRYVQCAKSMSALCPFEHHYRHPSAVYPAQSVSYKKPNFIINGLFYGDFQSASSKTHQLLEAMNYDADYLPNRYTSVRRL